MKRSTTSLIGITVAVALASPAEAKKNDPNINLDFRPQQTVAGTVPNVMGAMLDKPVAVRLEDDRRLEEPMKVGTRTDDDDRLWELMATNDVLAFVEQNLVGTGQKWGIRFDPSESTTLTVRLLEANVVETNQAVGAMYSSTVRLAYSIGGGEASSSAMGDATRYGKKFSNENCNEVLSDAMLEAFSQMFSDPALQRAWGD